MFAKFASMNTTTRILICLLALVISGCVFPSRLGQKNPYREDVTAFVVPGTTTRADVIAQLGDRYYESSDGHWLVFLSSRRMTEWFWFICTQGGCDGADFGGDIRWYYLIVEFGSEDTVRDFVVVTHKNPCAKKRACFLRSLPRNLLRTGPRSGSGARSDAVRR